MEEILIHIAHIEYSRLCDENAFTERSAIKIQKIFRGYRARLYRLPLVMYKMAQFLKRHSIIFTRATRDGRVNSAIDEDRVIAALVKHYKIVKPAARTWYDFLVHDNLVGYIPVNVKITTMTTADNIGNLATCLYSYTNHPMDLFNTRYNNGMASLILTDKLYKREYNRNAKRDYYFLVLKKTVDTESNHSRVIVNSVKGLKIIKPNINNLPFQVNWNQNQEFKYECIENKVNMFINCIAQSTPSWRDVFIKKVQNLHKKTMFCL